MYLCFSRIDQINITVSTYYFSIRLNKNALKIFSRWKINLNSFFLDDMNYDKNFRILPWSIFFRHFLIIILVFQTFVNGKDGQTKRSSDAIGDEKRVFDISFGNHKTYAIDDCIPLAFGDFNADKIIDIFCRNTKG